MDDSMAKGLVSRYQRESIAAHKRHQLFWLKHANRKRPLQARQQRKIMSTSLNKMDPFISFAHHVDEVQVYMYWAYIEQVAGFTPLVWSWDRTESYRPELLDWYHNDFVLSGHAVQRILQAHSPRWDYIGDVLNGATSSYQRILADTESKDSTAFMQNEKDMWWVFDKDGALLISRAYNDESDVSNSTHDGKRMDVLDRAWFHVVKTYIPFNKWDEWRHRAWDKWLLNDEAAGIALYNGDVVNLCSVEISEEDKRKAKSVFRTNQRKHNL